ncbi:Tryprostatin B 6-hydroxylase [Cytospora mali]|uniref:Tryprostatin B 6-hydroxylase n=1 Tax=Cytospora mali TaxID=578113 RepID=A0A194VRC2_CYTMA|nr:Tryprostatin B 6-hydroxylase [Valsa mali]
MNSSMASMGEPAAPIEILQVPLGGDVSQVAAAAAVLGVLFHVSILRTVEVEKFLYKFATLGFITIVSLCVSHIQNGYAPFAAILRVALSFVFFNGAVLMTYTASPDLQYFKLVMEWNRQYGDFIRTGPRELAIVRKSAVSVIYGPESKCRKSTWYAQVDTDSKKCSIHLMRDHDQHRKRRRAWDKGFAFKALNTYEPLINAKVEEFISQLSKLETIDATAWSMYLSFDIMGKVGFGKDFYGVTKGEEHPAIEGVHSTMSILGFMSHVPWLLNLMGRIPGAAAAYKDFFNWCSSEIEAKKKKWNPEEYPQDIVSWLIKVVMDKDPSASPTDAALHEDSRVIIVAGSETTATTLASIFYFLAKHPSVQHKLQSQVDSVLGKEWDYEKVKSITFIDDIINEALRLKPALLTGGYRVTPPEGITVDGTFIPGDINVFVPVQGIQTDPRYWKEADEFIPERFGERRDEMGTDGAPFIPFSLGAYSCPGKNLAFLSLRITLSRVMQEFDVSFAPGETGEVFDKEVKDTFTALLPPVMIRFTKRK